MQRLKSDESNFNKDFFIQLHGNSTCFATLIGGFGEMLAGTFVFEAMISAVSVTLLMNVAVTSDISSVAIVEGPI